MLRILVDFNGMTEDGRAVYINERVQPDLGAFSVGQRVIVYEVGDIEVEAVLETKTTEDGRLLWLAVPDWPTLKDPPPFISR